MRKKSQEAHLLYIFRNYLNKWSINDVFKINFKIKYINTLCLHDVQRQRDSTKKRKSLSTHVIVRRLFFFSFIFISLSRLLTFSEDDELGFNQSNQKKRNPYIYFGHISIGLAACLYLQVTIFFQSIIDFQDIRL